MPALNFLDWEHFEIPSTAGVKQMMLNGSLAFGVNILCFCIMVVASPLFLSTGVPRISCFSHVSCVCVWVGMVVGIPMSFFADHIVGTVQVAEGWFPAAIAGCLLSTIGPMILSVAEYLSPVKQDKSR